MVKFVRLRSSDERTLSAGQTIKIPDWITLHYTIVVYLLSFVVVFSRGMKPFDVAIMTCVLSIREVEIRPYVVVKLLVSGRNRIT